MKGPERNTSGNDNNSSQMFNFRIDRIQNISEFVNRDWDDAGAIAKL